MIHHDLKYYTEVLFLQKVLVYTVQYTLYRLAAA